MNGWAGTGEYFCQSDFQAVLSFAESSGMSWFTYWSVSRNRQYSPPGRRGVTSSECGSVPRNPVRLHRPHGGPGREHAGGLAEPDAVLTAAQSQRVALVFADPRTQGPGKVVN